MCSACIFIKTVSSVQNISNHSLGTNAQWVVFQGIKKTSSSIQLFFNEQQLSMLCVFHLYLYCFHNRLIRLNNRQKYFFLLIERNIILWLGYFSYKCKMFQTIDLVVQTLPKDSVKGYLNILGIHTRPKRIEIINTNEIN